MLTKILPEIVILKTTFPVKVGDIYKIPKKNSIVISVFGYKNKEKYPMYISKKCCEEKHVDLLLTEKKGKRDYVLIKDLVHSCVIILYTIEKNILSLLFINF